MVPRTKELFISYRSSDHREVDAIAEQLRSLKYDDGVEKFKTWQDKHDLKGGKSWWDGIVDAIIACDMFVFHLTPEYLASKVCMAELDYAIQRGRPIIPVVLDTAYFINPRTKKPEIDFWDAVPEWLGKYQFIFYNEEDFLHRFEIAVAEYERAWPQDIRARRPLNPDADSMHGTNYEVYASAIDYAQKVAFDDAKPLFRELVQRNDEDFAEICHQWLTLIEQYQDLLDAKRHRAPRMVFRRKWEDYMALFPLEFVDDLYPEAEEQPVIFDPNNLGKQQRATKKKPQAPSSSPSPSAVESRLDPTKNNSTVGAERVPPVASKPITPAKQHNPIEEALERARSFTGKRNSEWKPVIMKLGEIAPQTPIPELEMCLVPVGKFMMGADGDLAKYDDEKPAHEQTITKPYWIARYPVTNAEWRRAVEAGAVPKPKNTKWYDDKNMQNAPVVYVDWFMSQQFAQWAKCALPSEMHWEYASRGVESWMYPWGTAWEDGKHVIWKNTRQGEHPHAVTTMPEGASWVGAMHMIGNVWEWTSSEFKPYPYDASDGRERDTGDSTDVSRVLRAASWGYLNPLVLRSVSRFNRTPDFLDAARGVRCLRFD
jgi:formylglycine-generating enzyme required for sulfatase activity